MVTIEQVEKLREYADVTYEEAKTALERNDGDILQALIDLEHEGKTKAPQGGGKYESFVPGIADAQKTDETGKKKSKAREEEPSAFRENVNSFFKWLKEMLHKGNINLFVVKKRNENVIKLPVTILVLSLLLAFWVVIPLLVVGLFFNFQYSFEGPDLGKTKVNQVMDDVAQAAENIKNDMKK